MWKTVETKVGKISVGKTKSRRKKRGIEKEVRRKRTEKEGKNDRSKKSSKGIGNIG